MLNHFIARTVCIKMISHFSHNLNSNTHLYIVNGLPRKEKKKKYKVKEEKEYIPLNIEIGLT